MRHRSPTIDLTGVPVELIEEAARRQLTHSAAELEAHRLAVARVRARCGQAVAGPLGNRVAWQVLELLSDLP